MKAISCPYCSNPLVVMGYQMKNDTQRLFINCPDCGLLTSGYNESGITTLQGKTYDVSENQLSEKQNKWLKKKLQLVKKAREEKKV